MSGIQNNTKRSFHPIFLGTVLVVLGVILSSSTARAACSTDIGKVTTNEYNTLGSNNALNSSYVEIKLLPTPVTPSVGQTPLTTVPGWTLKSYTKTGVLLDTQAVASSGVGSCPGTPYRATALILNGDGYAHLLDASGNLVDVVYVNAAVPATVLGCALSTISIDKDIQGAGSSRKNISRDPDGTGNWIESLGTGNGSEATPCASNRDLLGVTKLASAATVYVGELVTFTMTVTNRTQFTTLSNVTLVDSLPVGFTRNGNTAPAGTSFNSATNTWTITSMAPGATYSLSLTARAGQVGNWTNSATGYVTYSGYQYQSDPATAAVIVLQPLTLAKTVSPSSVLYNTSATYTVTVTNNSSAALPASFTVNDTVPAGVTAGTPTASSGSSYSAGVWTINSGMAAGSSKTLTLPVTSQSTDGSFTNTATAVAPFGGANLSASATLVVSSIVISSFNAFESSTAANAITGVIQTKIAGTTFNLDVVAVSGGIQVASFTYPVKVELLANTGTPGSGYGTNNCPTANSVIQTISSTNIIGGRSAVSFSAVADGWKDVRVRISYPATGTPTATSCSTDSFAIRPNSFASINVTDSDWQTAGTSRILDNTSISNNKVHKAGQPFTIQASAQNAVGNTTVNYGDTPAVTLSACADTACTSTFGTLSVGGPAVNGILNSPTASYSEVGAFNLQLQDQSFANIDAGDGTAASCSGRYICSAVVTAGRFVPDHFSLLAGNSVTPACVAGGFIYMAQPNLTVSATVAAKNASDVTTLNYNGGLALATASWLAENNNSGTNLSSRLVLPATSWSSGVHALSTSSASFSRLATPDGAYDNLQLGVQINDPDGPTLLSLDMNPTTSGDCVATLSCIGKKIGSETKLRFGRLKLSNAHGSEMLKLPIPLQTQFWNTTEFVTNSLDNCTALISSNIGINTSLTGITATLGGAFVSGVGSLTLSKSSARGFATVCVDLGADPGVGTTCTATSASRSYLKGLWAPGTNYDNDPEARATYGVYKGANEFIYLRENY